MCLVEPADTPAGLKCTDKEGTLNNTVLIYQIGDYLGRVITDMTEFQIPSYKVNAFGSVEGTSTV